MNKGRIVFVLSLITFMLFIIPQVYAELYQDYNGNYITEAYGKEYIQHDGKELTESQFDKRMEYCTMMKIDNVLPDDLNCRDFVLTYEGEAAVINYMFFGKKMDN